MSGWCAMSGANSSRVAAILDIGGPGKGMGYAENFYFKAVVDWLEFEVRTVWPTNWQFIRRQLSDSLGVTVYVEARGDRRRSCSFRVRVQDPGSGDLPAAIATIHRELGLRSMPKLMAIEVSLDAYLKPGSDPDKLQALACRMYVAMQKRPSDNLRITGKLGSKGQVRWAADRVDLSRGIEAGLTAIAGSKTDPVMVRAYHKTSDAAGRVALPQELQRARFEVRLSKEALHFDGLDVLSKVGAVAFSDYFKFRRYADTASSLVACMRTSRIAGLLGNVRCEEKAAKHRRIHKPGTKADRDLNSRAYDALRALSKRLARWTEAWAALSAEITEADELRKSHSSYEDLPGPGRVVNTILCKGYKPYGTLATRGRYRQGGLISLPARQQGGWGRLPVLLRVTEPASRRSGSSRHKVFALHELSSGTPMAYPACLRKALRQQALALLRGYRPLGDGPYSPRRAPLPSSVAIKPVVDGGARIFPRGGMRQAAWHSTDCAGREMFSHLAS